METLNFFGWRNITEYFQTSDSQKRFYDTGYKISAISYQNVC